MACGVVQSVQGGRPNKAGVAAASRRHVQSLLHAQCSAAPRPSKAVSLVALTTLAQGEPVVISYGKLSNGFFLLDYGFIVPGNPP